MNLSFDYIQDSILEVESKFKEIENYFDFENIPKNKYDYAYHILATGFSPVEVDGIHVEDVNNFELRLYFKTKKNNREEIISHSSLAKDIRNSLVDRDKAGDVIKYVFVRNASFEYQTTNDNALIILMNIDITTNSTYK